LIVREAFRAASREIAANKFRSALSFAAVSVGVASLLYTLAMTEGMKLSLRRNLELMGPGRLTVEPKRNYVSKGVSPGLTRADADAIRNELKDLYMVAPVLTRWGAKGWAGRDDLGGVHVTGITPEFAKRDWVYKLVSGRFINGYDVAHRSRVAVMVLPPGWVKKPFWASFWNRGEKYKTYAERRDLMGKQVRFEDAVFTVVGILKPPPRDIDPRWDAWDTPEAFVTLTAFQDRLKQGEKREDPVDKIMIDTGSEATLTARRREVESILKRRHRGELDFEVKSAREDIESEMEQMRKYVTAGLTLGIVALLAGGIGIMNVTMATIFSRVKEIGIRRAVGAERSDILGQFLVEAALLGMAGGLAGVALGLLGVKWLATFNKEVASLTVLHCVEVTALASLVSALFAAGPAWQASKLDPVEALRAES
jgi:putative ABC transport system permease protein